MKRFTKMLALGMAAAMMLGMTVSAADSPTTGDAEVAVGIANEAIKGGGVKDAAGNVVESVEVKAGEVKDYSDAFGNTYEEALEKVDANPVIDAALDEAVKGLPAGKYDVYRDIIDVEVEGDIPAGGLYVSLLQAQDGNGYVIGHWNGTEWEVLQTKIEGGYVYALFPEGFSPVYLSILTLANEDEPDKPVEDEDNREPWVGDDDYYLNGDGAPVSPKTGEGMPVAGILAVICLAGAAVCAKKVRYNR